MLNIFNISVFLRVMALSPRFYGEVVEMSQLHICTLISLSVSLGLVFSTCIESSDN